MPTAAVAGGSRPSRARLGNLTNNGDGTSTAGAGSGAAQVKSSLARAAAAASSVASSTTASSPTSAFSDQQTVLGEWRRSQLLTAEGKDGPQQQQHSQQQPRPRQLALRVLEMHRHRRGLVPSVNDHGDGDAFDGDYNANGEIAINYNDDDVGSTAYYDTADDSSYHEHEHEHDDNDNDDDGLNAQYQDLLGRQQMARSGSVTKDKSSFERMPPPPPRNADRIRKGGAGSGGGAELSFVGNGKQKKTVNGGGTIASLLPSGNTHAMDAADQDADDAATVLTKGTAATAETALTANTSLMGGVAGGINTHNPNQTNQTHESDVILAQWRRERQRQRQRQQQERQRQGQGQGQGQGRMGLRVDTDLLSAASSSVAMGTAPAPVDMHVTSTPKSSGKANSYAARNGDGDTNANAIAATGPPSGLRIRGIRWSEQEEEQEEDPEAPGTAGGGFQLHADVSALTTTFDQHADGIMGTPMGPTKGASRGLPNKSNKAPPSILRTPSASVAHQAAATSATMLEAVSSPMATPKLSPIPNRHHDGRSIVTSATPATSTNLIVGPVTTPFSSNRERHLSNQIASLQAKLEESNSVGTEQQSQIRSLTSRLQQMELEAETARRSRDDVQIKLNNTSERIGRALGKIFAVLEGENDEGDMTNLTNKANTSSIPIADDIDVVVSRLVDDALPTLQRRAAQSSRTLEATKADLGVVQSEISVAQEQLQNLEKDRAEAEHDAVAARDRTKSIRMELSAVDEQLASGRNDLAHIQENIATLRAEERKVETHLNELRGEVRSKKDEAEELTKSAQERLDLAAQAEKVAKEAIDQSYVVKEGESNGIFFLY